LQQGDCVTVLVDQWDEAGGADMAVVQQYGSVQLLRHAADPELFPPHVVVDGGGWNAGGSVITNGDWNDDGLTDVLLGRWTGRSMVATQLGLAQPDDSYVWLPIPQYGDTTSWMMAELTGDGRMDLAFWRGSTPEFAVLPQDENGRPGEAVTTRLDNFYTAIGDPHDFDLDGFVDFIVRQNDNNSLHVLFGSSDLQFELEPTFTYASDVRVIETTMHIRTWF
jgi:hypothetical protein